MTRIRRVLIVSHAEFYQWKGQLYTFAHISREIEIWADLFEEVWVASPCLRERPNRECQVFSHPNVSVRALPKTGGRTLSAKVKQVFLLPWLVWELVRSMRQVDAIHVRFPSNLGLLSVILAPLFSKYRMAKYTIHWNGYAGEPWTYRLQRWLLRSRWWGAAVTVYGKWPEQPRHVISFFTGMMTTAEVRRVVDMAATKRIEIPLRILYCGRLYYLKRVDALLRAVELVSRSGLAIELAVVGGGPEDGRLRQLAADLGIQDRVRFVGAVPYEQTIQWYQWGHCLALPSVSEGWPKVVAEAMCHGLICLALDHGQVSTMLHERGILLKDGTPQEIAAALRSIADNPESFDAIRQAASNWSREFTVEKLRDALAELIRREWGAAVPHVP